MDEEGLTGHAMLINRCIFCASYRTACQQPWRGREKLWSPFPLVPVSHELALPRSLACWYSHVSMWHEGCLFAPRSSACSSDVQPTYYCCPSCPGLPDHVGDSKAKLASPTPPHLHICPAACTAVWLAPLYSHSRPWHISCLLWKYHRKV